ncbi:hypothetical protein ANO14919_129900 [Xylariales sp. No.14919]|nr:hypothetical protein ANO14919_129900 [Xylariales sp. No.14919]
MCNSPSTTIVPFQSLPSCAADCSGLYDANGACVPPVNPSSDPDSWETCFCAYQELQPFYTTTKGVCDTSCSEDPQALGSIRQWFTSLCNPKSTTRTLSTHTGTASQTSIESEPGRATNSNSSSSSGDDHVNDTINKGLSRGAVGGILAGAIAGALVFGLFLWLIFHYRRMALEERRKVERELNRYEKPELDASSTRAKRPTQLYELSAEPEIQEMGNGSMKPAELQE